MLKFDRHCNNVMLKFDRHCNNVMLKFDRHCNNVMLKFDRHCMSYESCNVTELVNQICFGRVGRV